jgi:hypothetical protein
LLQILELFLFVQSDNFQTRLYFDINLNITASGSWANLSGVVILAASIAKALAICAVCNTTSEAVS